MQSDLTGEVDRLKQRPPQGILGQVNQAACAHIHVAYYLKRAGAGTSGWWACVDCQLNFIPLPLAEHLIQKERERCAMIADDGRCCVANAVCAQIPAAILSEGGGARKK